jgi:ethanolamine utilization protein EutN
MILGKIVGNVVSTRKHEHYRGYKILVVQPITPQEKPAKSTFLAIDTVQAGAGDTVLVIDEGNSARQVIDNPVGAIRSVVVGIVDEFNREPSV